MRNSIHFALALAFTSLALAVAGPAPAQDGSGVAARRTIEGAQKFLVATSESARIIYWEKQWEKLAGDIRHNQSHARFSGAVDGQQCATMAQIEIEFEQRNWALNGKWETYRETRPFPIHWGYVSQVALNGSSVSISWRSGLSTQDFAFPSDELAQRTAAAFEFLRVSCDKNHNLEEETGF